MQNKKTSIIKTNKWTLSSQGHYRLYFGLGQHERSKEVKIRRPDGSVKELDNVLGDTLLVVQQETRRDSSQPLRE